MSIVISALPLASALTGDEAVPLVQDGITKQATSQAIADLVGTDTPISPLHGGTGLSSYAQGDILYASAANTLTTLGKDTNATRYLSNTGTSNNPAWAQVSLSTGVSGTLPVGNGGTGQITATAAANALLPDQTGHASEFLQTDGAGALSWAPSGGGSITFSVAGGVVAANSLADSYNVNAFSHLGAGLYQINVDAILTGSGASANPTNANPTFHIAVAGVIPYEGAYVFAVYDGSGVLTDGDFTFTIIGGL